MRLSVVIVNWNTRDLLLACLRSLERFPPDTPYEIIVVDNASLDGSAAAVRQEFPRVNLISSENNTGYAAGNNLGFAVATGSCILTLNPDTEMTDDTLERSLHKMDQNPDAGCLGARQVYTDGSTQHSVRGFPTFLGILGDLTGLGKIFPRSKLGSYRLVAFDYDQEGPAPQPMGTFLLFRRHALETAGDPKKPFDEEFPIFFNEVDLLYRLEKKGWTCLYSPDLRVLHHGGESTKLVRKNMIWESHKSLVRFLRKHYGTPWNAPGLAVLAGVIYAAAFVRARGYHGGFAG